MATLDSERLLDDVGWHLLVELQRDARLSYSELGRRVGLTPPAVIDRLRRMEDAGIIVGYRAQLNLERLGLPMRAIIRLHAGDAGCGRFAAAVRDFPEILECHRVTGTDCFVLKAAVPSVQALELLLDRLAPYGQTTTSVVLSSVVEHRVIGPTVPAPADAALADAAG